MQVLCALVYNPCPKIQIHVALFQSVNVTVPCLRRESRRSVHQEERAPSCPPGQTVSRRLGAGYMAKIATYFINKQEKVLIASVEVGFRDSMC